MHCLAHSGSSMGYGGTGKQEWPNDADRRLTVPPAQERFHQITHSYYKGCNGILLVFDVTSPDHIVERIQYWLENINVIPAPLSRPKNIRSDGGYGFPLTEPCEPARQYHNHVQQKR